jgi:signal transduction histidine kinase
VTCACITVTAGTYRHDASGHNQAVTDITDHALDLSLRRVFAILIGYWIAYWLAITPIVWLSSGAPPVLGIGQYAVLMALAGAALLIVQWPSQGARPNRLTVPVAVAFCTLAFLIERHWFLLQGNAPAATPGQLMHAHVLRQDFILLVLIVAWQFRYRAAVAYTLAITLAEGAMVAIADLANPLLSGITQRELVVRCLIFLLIAFAVNRLIRRQRQQHADLLAANARLADFASTIDQLSASQERNRLSRELHDTLAHSLSALVVQLEAVDSLWPRDAGAARG